MKKISLAVMFLLTVLAVQANDLIKYAPKNSSILLNLNLKKMLQFQSLKDVLDSKDNEELNDFKKDLAKYNLTLDTLADDMLVFVDMSGENGEPDFGLLAKTTIKEDVTKKFIEDQCKKNNTEMKATSVDGKKVYSFSTEMTDQINSGIPVSPMNDEMAITYLKDDVVLVTGQSAIAKYLSGLAKGIVGKVGKPALLVDNKVDEKGVLWGAVDVAKFIPQPGPGPDGSVPPPQPHQSIKTGVFSLNLAGQKKEDILMNVDLICTDAQNAQLLAMQMQFGLTAMSFQMKDNQKLALEVANSVKIKPQGEKLSLVVDLKKATLDQIKEYSEKKNGKVSSQSSELEEDIAIPEAEPKKVKKATTK